MPRSPLSISKSKTTPPTTTLALSCLWEGCGQVFPSELECYAHICLAHSGGNWVNLCRWIHEASAKCATKTTTSTLYCGVEFTNKKGLSEHAITHFSHEMKPIQCAICNVRLRNRQGLRKHRLAVHAAAMAPANRKKYSSYQTSLPSVHTLQVRSSVTAASAAESSFSNSTNLNQVNKPSPAIEVAAAVIARAPRSPPPSASSLPLISLMRLRNNNNSTSFFYFPLRTDSLPTPPAMEIGIQPRFARNMLEFHQRGSRAFIPIVFWNMLRSAEDRGGALSAAFVSEFFYWLMDANHITEETILEGRKSSAVKATLDQRDYKTRHTRSCIREAKQQCLQRSKIFEVEHSLIDFSSSASSLPLIKTPKNCVNPIYEALLAICRLQWRSYLNYTNEDSYEIVTVAPPPSPQAVFDNPQHYRHYRPPTDNSLNAILGIKINILIQIGDLTVKVRKQTSIGLHSTMAGYFDKVIQEEFWTSAEEEKAMRDACCVCGDSSLDVDKRCWELTMSNNGGSCEEEEKEGKSQPNQPSAVVAATAVLEKPTSSAASLTNPISSIRRRSRFRSNSGSVPGLGMDRHIIIWYVAGCDLDWVLQPLPDPDQPIIRINVA